MTAAEREDLGRAHAERLFRASDSAAEGSARDPFDPLPGGLFAIRKRAGGACGFLSRENRCRLHEELGGRRKPLSCQVFPFRFHGPAEAGVMTVSSACPTVVRERGQALGAQVRELRGLGQQWQRAFPEPCASIQFVAGHALQPAALDTLVELLLALLDRPGPRGAPDLRANVGRMAALLDDLTRRRVLRLGPERFAEYLSLVGRQAATSAQPAAARPASAVARLLFRGFLFAVLAGQLQLADGRASGLRLALRFALARLLLHLHGLWPGSSVFDRRQAVRARVDLQADGTRQMAQAFFRRSLRTLGTGRRPLLDELAVSVALLNVALVLAAARAARVGRTLADESDLEAGLSEAAGPLARGREQPLRATAGHAQRRPGRAGPVRFRPGWHQPKTPEGVERVEQRQGQRRPGPQALGTRADRMGQQRDQRGGRERQAGQAEEGVQHGIVGARLVLGRQRQASHHQHQQ